MGWGNHVEGTIGLGTLKASAANDLVGSMERAADLAPAVTPARTGQKLKQGAAPNSLSTPPGA
ncbi:MAG: hypothetical protein JNK06_05350 [Candidatus Accumulibacter phosphatis]|uniref:hypothetical protein n=1 Tax=Candidatus Accumulibacter phosphatis TaxID=327160 RepID=UPI001A4E5750|nr:hypothetical protein [Candidatus Accumulibacter phosphatis]